MKAAKMVADATSRLVEVAREVSARKDEDAEELEASNQTASRKAQFDKQVEILRLERELERARNQLGKQRADEYAVDGGSGGATNSGAGAARGGGGVAARGGGTNDDRCEQTLVCRLAEFVFRHRSLTQERRCVAAAPLVAAAWRRQQRPPLVLSASVLVAARLLLALQLVAYAAVSLRAADVVVHCRDVDVEMHATHDEMNWFHYVTYA